MIVTMKRMPLRRSLAWVMGLGAAVPAHAASCIEQTVKSEPAAQEAGQASQAARQGEVVYLITLRIVCARPVEGLVIDKPIPRHMTYIKTTAKGEATDRLFSWDGRSYDRWDNLSVTAAGAPPRPVTPADIKSIRWVFKAPIQPGETSQLRFHALKN